MKRSLHIQLILALVTAFGIGLAALTSCDTPRSIAWSYYYCAEDTLAAGDPLAAKHFLKRCNKTADKALATKADSLMEVIENMISEQEKKHS